MATPWYAYPITQAYGQNGEKGVDLGVPFHTPITALYAGTVRTAGRTQWACGSSGGMISIVCNVPGIGVKTSYYLHMDSVTKKVGDTVQAGEVIGLSGGQLSGGQWPVVNCPQKGITYSTGAHIEFGFNAPWVSGPGSPLDPSFAITQARNGTLPHTTPDGTATVPISSVGSQAHPDIGGAVVSLDPTLAVQGILAFSNLSSTTKRVITQPVGFDGMCEALDAAEQFPDWNWMNPFGSIFADFKPFALRFTVVVIGFLVLYMAFREQIRAATERAASGISMVLGGPQGLQQGISQAAVGRGVLAEAPEALAG